MRYLPLLALLLVGAAPAKKKAAAKPAMSVSLAEVVKICLKRGVDWTVDEMRAKNLGYDVPPVTKEFVLDADSAPTQLAVMVTLTDDAKTARDVMVSSTSVTEFAGDQPAAIDGYTFRADLNGKLVSGIRARGKLDAVMQEKLDTSSSETKKRFNAILASVRSHPSAREAKK